MQRSSAWRSTGWGLKIAWLLSLCASGCCSISMTGSSGSSGSAPETVNDVWRQNKFQAERDGQLFEAIPATTQERSLQGVYALYNLPPFTVTFRTQRTTALENALEASLNQGTTSTGDVLISETNGVDSSLSFPLRSTTQDFLIDRFEGRIQQLEAEQNQMDPDQAFEWFPLYSELIRVDLDVQMYWVGGKALSQEEPEDATRRKLQSHVTLQVICYGTLAFEEPPQSSAKPSNDEVRSLFGAWMESIFQEHRDQYLRELVQTDQAMLREISSLSIQTNIDSSINGSGVTSPSSSSSYSSGWPERTEKALLTMLILLGIMGFGWMILYLRQRKYHPVLVNGVGGMNGNDSYGWIEPGDLHLDIAGASDRVGSVTPTSMGIARPGPLSMADRSGSLDAVRHGDDVFHKSSVSGAVSVLEHTNRYLHKHRLDLPDSSMNGATSTFNVFGRDYSIPSNPFEYIYSAFSEPYGQGFATSPQGAFTPRQSNPAQSISGAPHPSAPVNSANGAFGRRPSTLEAQRENIASTSATYLEDAENGLVSGGHVGMTSTNPDTSVMPPIAPPGSAFGGVGEWTEGGGFHPVTSIWRNITGMWDYTTAASAHDVRQYGHDAGHFPPGHTNPQQFYSDGNMELQEISLDHQYPDTTYQDPDPADYNFPFKDFPRHDGTPCLIFNEDALKQKAREEVFEIGSLAERDANNASTPSLQMDPTKPVSDADFQKMLSQNSQYTEGSSFEDSIFSDEETGNQKATEDSISRIMEAKLPEFQDKLSRLMQQKHRQYEKKAIVEKHQEKRAKERKQLREQERRERHKAMERDIEDIEAAATSQLAGNSANSISTSSTGARARDYSSGATSSPHATTSSARWATSPKASHRYSPITGTNAGSNLSSYSPKQIAYRQGYSPYRHSGGVPSPSRIGLSPVSKSGYQQPTLANPSPIRGNVPDSDSARSFRTGGSSPYRPNSSTLSEEGQNESSVFRPKTSYQNHSNDGDIERKASSGSRHSASSPSVIEGLNESLSSNSSSQPFRMRPRTVHPGAGPRPGAGLTNPGEFSLNSRSLTAGLGRPRTASADFRTNQTTIDNLSMPANLGMPQMTISGNKKYPSPSSVMDDLLGAPTSISRKKGTATSPSASHLSSQQHQSQRHRRVNSFDHRAMAQTQDIRRVPQQRRRNRTKSHQRSLTPTRDFPTAGRPMTPTRAMIQGNHQRSLTPMTAYMYQQSTSSPVSTSSHRRIGSSSLSQANPHPLDTRDNGVVARTRFV